MEDFLTLCVRAPEIDELCCIVCEIDSKEVQDSSAKSNFHWQTMKCRYLIYKVPEIISSAVEGTEDSIMVIMKRQYYMTGKCHELLKQMNLKFSGVRSLTTQLYRTCINYTIQCKVAPYFNKVGAYFLAGKDYYNDRCPTKAIELEVIVDGKLHLRLASKRVKLLYVQLEHFYLSSKESEEFLADPQGYIDFSKESSRFVHVLPSMKRGRVLSISKTIPAECPFKDYEQLRRHWKNMYGFFLPRNGYGVVYYQIKFPVRGTPIFTYPHLCIVTEQLQLSANKDKEETIKHFVGVLRKTVPSICGEELAIAKCICHRNITSDIAFQSAHTLSLPSTANRTNKIEFSANYLRNTGNFGLDSHLLRVSQVTNTDPANAHSKTTADFPPVTSTPVEDESTSNNTVVSKDRQISSYFKIQKPHVSNVKVQVNENRSQISVHGMAKRGDINESAIPLEADIDIVAVARDNQLGTLKIKQLSDWLKKNAIAHNPYGKKADLIEKILAHIRNTQKLQRFRV